jgi:hypothetical protein
MPTTYVVQVDTSIDGEDSLWTDFLHTDEAHQDRHYTETVNDYPHRRVRLVKRVTTEEVVRRNYL